MTWLKSWLLSGVKAALLKAVDSLDKYEGELADIIRKNVDPDKSAKMVVDYIQDWAKKLIEKAL